MSYLYTLPNNYKEFPLFYNEKEMDQLKGSPFRDEFYITNELLEEHYNNICDEIPEFKLFPFEEFSQVLTIVYSRVFTVNIPNKAPQTCMVPFADMINHSVPMKANYYYDEESRGLVFEAVQDIIKGEEVTTTYGESLSNFD